jgi:hypothetical protein
MDLHPTGGITMALALASEGKTVSSIELSPSNLSPENLKNSRTSQFALIAAVAGAAVTPMLLFGYHRGHDLEIHLQSWMDASAQFRHGILYPRWASGANYGFGEPRFLFYPPASWMLGGALGLVLPWRIVPAVYVWLTMILAALNMRKLAGEWLPPGAALLAGLVYALNPYFMVTAYTRCAYGELLASAIFPLLLWGALRIEREPRKSVAVVAVSLAAIWLTNLPAGVMASYALACVLLVLALVHRSILPLLYGATATLAGIGIAAFSLLPAAWEQKWVNIRAITTAELSTATNFLFSRFGLPNTHEFNRRISPLAVLLILTAIAAAIAARRTRVRLPTEWWSLTVLCGLSAFLMFRVSSPLWRILPELRYLQFPWRWLFALCAATVLLLGFAVCESKRRRVLWPGIALITLVLDAGTMHTREWFPHVTGKIADQFRSGAGYPGLPEYAPVAEGKSLPTDAPLISVADPAADVYGVHVEPWSSEKKVVVAELSRPTAINLKLLAYPAWQASVNGKPVALQENPQTGQLMVSLPAGFSRTEITFGRTWDRAAGIWISVASCTALLLFSEIFAARRKRSMESRTVEVAPAEAA